MRKFFVFILLLTASFMISACGSDSEKNGHANEEAIPDTDKENTNDKSEKETDKAIIRDLGIYVGQIDPHSVEIETNEGPKAFQLNEESSSLIEDLEPNDEVKFHYYVNADNQNILETIEKMNSANNEKEQKKIEETGIYNGQQDPHTIEIETKEGPQAFQLSDQARTEVEQLKEGKEVTFIYYKEGPQLIIETIKQTE
ncbi:hypothetical protein DCC39_04035 [Pueribacillus theae]|uniref:Lipoprotein n=1 Tax=Pueribacillus theae TaxID=2171751 RepID=A0A2U1K616_9BACI|nr:hypothetical protein [Pueribacillus theae]PWA12822.1 hypothetical protein DCC39_04035 [Pueribacillus theae]